MNTKSEDELYEMCQQSLAFLRGQMEFLREEQNGTRNFFKSIRLSTQIGKILDRIILINSMLLMHEKYVQGCLVIGMKAIQAEMLSKMINSSEN